MGIDSGPGLRYSESDVEGVIEKKKTPLKTKEKPIDTKEDWENDKKKSEPINPILPFQLHQESNEDDEDDEESEEDEKIDYNLSPGIGIITGLLGIILLLVILSVSSVVVTNVLSGSVASSFSELIFPMFIYIPIFLGVFLLVTNLTRGY